MNRTAELENDFHHLVRELLDANGRLTEIVTHFRGLVLNDSPYAAVVVLDANGMWTKTFTTTYAGVAIANPSAALVTVTNTSQGSGPPVSGNGVMIVRSGTARTKVMAGDQLTIYGAPGAQVDVNVFNKPPVPAFGPA